MFLSSVLIIIMSAFRYIHLCAVGLEDMGGIFNIVMILINIC